MQRTLQHWPKTLILTATFVEDASLVAVLQYSKNIGVD